MTEKSFVRATLVDDTPIVLNVRHISSYRPHWDEEHKAKGYTEITLSDTDIVTIKESFEHFDVLVHERI